MKKRNLNLSQYLTVLALVFYFVILTVQETSTNSLGIMPTQVAGTLDAIIFVLGAVFIFSATTTFVKVGYGLLTVIATTNLNLLINGVIEGESLSEILIIVVIVLLIIAVVKYFIGLVLTAHGFTKAGAALTGQSKASKLKAWKKLADEQKLSQAQYSEIKTKILSNNYDAKALDDLYDLVAEDLLDSHDIDTAIQA